MLWETRHSFKGSEFDGVCVDFWKAVSNTFDLKLRYFFGWKPGLSLVFRDFLFSECGGVGYYVVDLFVVCQGGVTFSASQLPTLNENSSIAGHRSSPLFLYFHRSQMVNMTGG